MTVRDCLRVTGWLSPPLVAVIALFGVVPSGAVAGADTPKPAANVFTPGKVLQVHVTLSAEEYTAIQPRGGRGFPGFGPAPKDPPPPVDPKREVHHNNFGVDLPWGTGAVTVGDETFDKVGIRYKGNGTIGDASRTIKKSIKIDLDRVGGTGRFGGSKTINLHCGVTDPSKCRETLGYAIYRDAGVPAPRTTFAEVRFTVPGKFDKEYLGLYTVVEEVDKRFLNERFGSDKGLLMKPEGLREFEDRGDDWERYKKTYAPKRDATKAEAARMIAFAKLVHKADDAAFNKQIESYLDIDNYLRFLAATSFVANTDSFFVLGHNYCLHLDSKTNKLSFIPWDLDRSFANFPILGSNNQQMNMSLVHPYAGTHRLTERVLAVPGVAERFQKVLKELAGTAFDKTRLLKELTATETAVKELVERDKKAATARKDGVGGFGPPGVFGTPPPLATFIEKRTKSVAAQVAGTSKGYVPTAGFGPPKLGVVMAPPMMEAMDKDKDDMISRTEWVAGAKRLFDACEKDKDGCVDMKSLKVGLNGLLPPPPEGTPRSPFNLGDLLGGSIFDRADANKDGKLTLEEITAAAGATFDAADKAKAGKLDEEAFGEYLTAIFPLPKFGEPKKN